MEWLENLNANGKAVYFLSLTELLINKLSDANYYDIVKKSIDLGWQWVFQKDVAADDLYYYLENLSENDILSYLQMESDSEKEAVLICVAEALSYVIYEAYTYENAKYMPETIEAVDGTTTDEFVYAFKSVCRISGIMDDMKDFCIMNFPKNENKNVNKEFIDSYIRDKVSRYDD